MPLRDGCGLMCARPDRDLQSLLAQIVNAAAANGRVGVSYRGGYRTDSGPQDCLCTRRRQPVVVAWLERDDKCGPLGSWTRRAQSQDLGVAPTGRLGGAFAQDGPVIANDHGADWWVWMRTPPRPPREFQGASHGGLVGCGGVGAAAFAQGGRHVAAPDASNRRGAGVHA